MERERYRNYFMTLIKELDLLNNARHKLLSMCTSVVAIQNV